MRTLIEDLYANNVIFSYYGFIDNSVLGEVLQITKSKLESNGESASLVDRLLDAINECVQNIIKHNFFPDEPLHYKSLLVVSKKENAYLIDAINVVNDSQKESINEQLSMLNSKSKQELQSMKAQQSLVHASPAPMAANAMIDLFLKSDSCEYTFKNLEENFLFNINFKIDSLN